MPETGSLRIKNQTAITFEELEEIEELQVGARFTFSNTIEVEGETRPAFVAETISMIYAKGK